MLKGKRDLAVGTASPLYGDNSIRTAKYTLYSFFLLNLFEQFKKPANVYFLVLSILQVVRPISISEGQPTILLPLVFVVVVAMIKDFLEDRKRSNSDREENFMKVFVLRAGQFVEEKSCNLLTGDIIKVGREDFIPADILMLYGSNSKNDCFIETKNLDGETNLKQKYANPRIRQIMKSKAELNNMLGATFNFEAPNADIHEFSGAVTHNTGTFGVDKDNFILRGCRLKNTEEVIGVVSFTGHYTKVMMNSVKSKMKSSDMEDKLGRQILIVFAMLVGPS